MTVIVTASGPADILAMVPSLVGFAPRDSVVILAFRGPRTCGAFRFDLPPSGATTMQAKAASFIAGTLCRLPRVDAAVAVICTDDLFAGGSDVPRSDFAALVGRRIQQCGFELRASICQAADGWASYLDSSVPAGGHPLAEISGSTAAAAIPDDLRGRGGEVPCRVADADSRTMTRVRTQIAEYQRRYERLATAPTGDPMPELACFDPLADIPLFAEGALAWHAAQLDAHGALLVFALQGQTVRDLVMLQWASGLSVGDRLWEETVGERRRAPSREIDIGDLMLGIGPRPDPGRVERAIALLETLVSWAEDARRPPLLCMLAWLNWALGRGTRAGRHLGEALAIDPRYAMAQLLGTMMGNGTLPEWAFDEPAGPRWRRAGPLTSRAADESAR